jgi:hypothetical protein
MEQISYNTLKDFDWSARIILSSDKLSGLKKPVVMLQLTTVDCNGVEKQSLLELSKEDTKVLLEKLRKIQKIQRSLAPK